eukprot:1184452-Prorocentrum_minimum.AAC.1
MKSLVDVLTDAEASAGETPSQVVLDCTGQDIVTLTVAPLTGSGKKAKTEVHVILGRSLGRRCGRTLVESRRVKSLFFCGSRGYLAGSPPRSLPVTYVVSGCGVVFPTRK